MHNIWGKANVVDVDDKVEVGCYMCECSSTSILFGKLLTIFHFLNTSNLVASHLD